MNPLRSAFVEGATLVQQLLVSDALEARWDEPSCLREFSVRGLAGHLVRAVTSVGTYLDQPAPAGGDPISPARYYLLAVDEPDIDARVHAQIRARGEAEAAGGRGDLAERLTLAIDDLRHRLGQEPEDRLVQVYGGLILRLDDYLVTRIVELAVHADDLGESIGMVCPEMPPQVTGPAIAALVGTARLRHGDVAVLRALTRRERDAVEALRVL